MRRAPAHVSCAYHLRTHPAHSICACLARVMHACISGASRMRRGLRTSNAHDACVMHMNAHIEAEYLVSHVVADGDCGRETRREPRGKLEAARRRPQRGRETLGAVRASADRRTATVTNSAVARGKRRRRRSLQPAAYGPRGLLPGPLGGVSWRSSTCIVTTTPRRASASRSSLTCRRNCSRSFKVVW